MEAWIGSGFNANPCEENTHEWNETQPVSSFNEETKTLTVHYVCNLCGLSRDEHFPYSHADIIDAWTDMREEE